jgi:tetratricopeptide (TPR) repeat protein
MQPPNLPRRVRQHILEDLSISGFRDLKPENWVFREKSIDYGIDGEVEIFDSQQHTTGHVFLVQLRATDRSLRLGARLRLETRTYNYFRSLSLPVLIARWIEPERALFCLWAHSLDPTPAQRSRKSFSIRFNAENRFDSATSAKQIERDVANYWRVIKSTLTVPINIEVKFELLAQHVAQAVDAISQFREVSRIKRFPFTFSDAGDSPRIYLYVRQKEIRVSVAGLPGIVLDLSPMDWRDPQRFLAPHTLVSLLVIALSHARQPQAALQLSLSNLDLISKCTNEQMRIGVFEVLTRNQRLDAAFELIKLTPDASPRLRMHFHSLLLRAASGAPEHIASQYVNGMKMLAVTPSAPNRATADYNIGNLYLNRSQYKLALRHFLRAGRVDPMYRKRDYFQRDLGVAYFELGRYGDALRAYLKAKSLGAKGNIECVIADCLLFLGRFGESRRLFEKGLRENPAEIMKWGLKLYALNYIVDHLQYKIQKRRRPPPIDITKLQQATSLEAIWRVVVPVFDRDVLLPFAWFNLGIGAEKFGNYELAEMAFLMAAMFKGNDPEAWGNTLISGLNARSPTLCVAMIVNEAYRVSGEQFITYVRETIKSHAKSQAEVDKLEHLLSGLANSAHDQLAAEDVPPVIRIIDPEGRSYVEVPLRKGEKSLPRSKSNEQAEISGPARGPQSTGKK